MTVTAWTAGQATALLERGHASRNPLAAHGWSIYDPALDEWADVVQEHADLLERAAGGRMS